MKTTLAQPHVIATRGTSTVIIDTAFGIFTREDVWGATFITPWNKKRFKGIGRLIVTPEQADSIIATGIIPEGVNNNFG